MTYDYCVIGGGIVGLATALKLQELRPGCSVVVLEKEPALAQHQTGHDSGVIHAGIYYAPGSLKAELCSRGAEAAKTFCEDHGIPYEVCGKLVVATSPVEVQRLEALRQRSGQNGIEVEKIDAAELRRREPRISDLAALFVPSTGIVDYGRVCSKVSDLARAGRRDRSGRGGRRHQGRGRPGHGIDARRHLDVKAPGRLRGPSERPPGAPRGARRAAPDHSLPRRVFPSSRHQERRRQASDLSRSRPRSASLGVHLTRMIDGSVTVGPNAVLGFSRENPRRYHVNVRDVAEYLMFPGLWRVLAKNAAATATEMRNSFWKRGYLEECRRYCPELALADLLPHPAGIRSQAVLRDGSLVHDFLFMEPKRMLHVCNAPSPAATSAFPIGEMIARRCVGSAPDCSGPILWTAGR